MLAEATVALLTLMVFSHLALQWHCFGFRAGLPAIIEATENRIQTGSMAVDERAESLLKLVDEGVQILSDLADSMEAPVGAQNAPSVPPVLGALTALLNSRAEMSGDYGSAQPQRTIQQENDNEATPPEAGD